MGSHVQLCLGLGWAIMGLPRQTQPTLGSRQILTAVALFVESFGPSYVESFGPNWISDWKLNMAPMFLIFYFILFFLFYCYYNGS